MKPQPKPGILDIAPYVPGKSVAAPGKKIIKLASNETPLGASPKAIEAYVGLAEKLHRYPDGTATLLRDAIAEVHKLDAEKIICGAGSDELIGLMIHAYASPGENIVMSAHGFLMYKIYAQGFGVQTIMADEKNLTADVDAILSKVNDKTKLVFIANPNNPTGTYLPTSEIQRLRVKLPQHIILVLDLAYAEYVKREDYTDGKTLVDAGENTAVLRTFSKIYGLPALRIGWGYMPASMVDVINRIRGPFNVSTPAQIAGAAAVHDQDFVNIARAHNDKWLKWLGDELSKLGLKVYPSVANFVLVEFPEGKHSAANANLFLMNEGIIPREVKAYGLPNCLRITIGLEDENKAVLAALSAFLKA